MFPRLDLMGHSNSRAGLGIALLVAFSGTAWADGLVVTLVPPSGEVPGGSTVVVGVLAANPGDSEMDFAPPPVIHGIIAWSGRSWPVELDEARGGVGAVAPGRFSELEYSLKLPPTAGGPMVLEVSEGLPHPLTAVVSVGMPIRQEDAAAVPSTDGVTAAAATEPPAGQSALSQLPRSLVDRFGALDPMYFIYGPKTPAAKFQFSLKYRLLTFDSGQTDAADSTLQFGYTQRSLWDLSAASPAFYDTSYMPSLFYQFLAPAPAPADRDRVLTWLGLASGYQHESNGQGGTLERSMNTLFVRTGVLIGRPDRWHAVASARLFDYVGGVANNPQIKDYRGYGSWGLTLAAGDGPSLTYTGWAGRDFNHVTSQFDLNLPVKVKFMDFGTYLLVEYFHGYGESLREYEQYSDTLRAGISLVR
jgi:outer membrane phospholipase A